MRQRAWVARCGRKGCKRQGRLMAPTRLEAEIRLTEQGWNFMPGKVRCPTCMEALRVAATQPPGTGG